MSAQVQAAEAGAPLRKGIWAFPAPYFIDDWAWRKHARFMPKRCLEGKELNERQEAWTRKHKNLYHTRRHKFFWAGKVFSRVQNDRFGRLHRADWYVYPNATLFAKAATKALWQLNHTNGISPIHGGHAACPIPAFNPVGSYIDCKVNDELTLNVRDVENYHFLEVFLPVT